MNRWLAAALALVALAAAGCGGSGNGTAEPATVEGSEYAYVMPDEIDGGVVSMRFRNTGKEPHEFALVRIGGGHTIDETIRDFFANDGRVPYVTDIGGVPLLTPGEEIALRHWCGTRPDFRGVQTTAIGRATCGSRSGSSAEGPRRLLECFSAARGLTDYQPWSSSPL